MWKKLSESHNIGVRYIHGKLLIYKLSGNPEPTIQPAWAVDIREIIAMGFVGAGALCFIIKGESGNAMILLTGLLSYAIGRTVPGGKP